VKWRTRIQVGIIHAVLATSLAAQKETFAPANDVSFSNSFVSLPRIRRVPAIFHGTQNYRLSIGHPCYLT
jgi:hypothetical protein